MAKKCCIKATDLRVISVDLTTSGTHVVYTVPAGRVFVVTSWSIVIDNGGHTSAARLVRSGVRVAFNRMYDSVKSYNHLTFPTGIPFSAGESVEIDSYFNFAQHFLHGYEKDA